MSSLTALDWGIILAYLVVAVAIGAWTARRASESTASFFVAGRSLPWWAAGTSMVATTFAADTPLWVTGAVATYGIAGNWFWWSFAIVHVLAAVYLARLWRRAEVMTDAGVIEERYSGKPAASLRAFKAFFFAVPINCITMGWVILAMRKIMGVFIDWEVLLPDGWYASLVAHWPAFIGTFDGAAWEGVDPSTAISVVLAMTLAVAYSALGGLRGVVITDILQFSLAMIGAISVAWFAVSEVGGLGALVDRLHESGQGEALDYVPASDSTWMPLHLFGMYLFVLWWAQKYSDAGGYMVQRMAATRDPRHAAKATLLFTTLHYVGRSWPWILAGLAALILYPMADYPGLDREATYPMLLRDVLPVGLLGVAVASLVAAFMSTIDTHVNWGASYLVTDLYRRFIKRDGDEAHYVKASRWGVVLMAVTAAIIATQMTSIDAAWKLFNALGSGLGLVALARWTWWRVNAWSELSALATTLVLTIALPLIFGALGFTEPAYRGGTIYTVTVLLTMAGSTVVWVTVTLLTPPTDPAVLDAFYRRVRPLGFWGPVRARCPDAPPLERGRAILVAWVTGVGFIYALLFGVGELLVGSTALGLGLAVAGLGLGVVTYRLILPRETWEAGGAASGGAGARERPAA